MDPSSGATRGSDAEPGAAVSRARGAASGPRLLFLFPHPIADEFDKVAQGISPTERLYGAHELRTRGWNIAVSDSRFSGLFGGILKFLRQFGIMGIGPGTMLAMARSDIVIVKDDFSAMTAVAARLLGKKLIFLDSMFGLPQRWWKTLGIWISLRLAHETVCYSQFQKQLWQERFGSVARSIRVLPYTIDVRFYRPHAREWQPGGPRKVLAVGRDVGRDYATLVEALRGTDLKLDLIALPYLLRGLNVENDPQITVHQRLSYEDLFRLYSECAVVAIPLKAGITYPSGIRALFESMVLRRPFVATRNEVLQEYMTEEGVHGYMVPPHDSAALRETILAIVARGEANGPMIDAAAKMLEANYDVAAFANAFEKVLRDLWARQASPQSDAIT
jgi:glycosyltransferase involved in cell wall biosynthesis